VFYKLIPEYETLGAVLHLDPPRAARVVELLRQAEQIWYDAHLQKANTVGEIRRGLIPESEMVQIVGQIGTGDWQNFESRNCQYRVCTQHGDLHCGNVIVGKHSTPILIDFADVGEAIATLDPITMELGALFHPKWKCTAGGWPTPERAQRWANLDDFLVGCPVEPFVRATRAWANAAAVGQRQICVTAYICALRQLKYKDTDKDIARAIIRAAISAFP